jgi:hypothetical protein
MRQNRPNLKREDDVACPAFGADEVVRLAAGTGVEQMDRLLPCDVAVVERHLGCCR